MTHQSSLFSKSLVGAQFAIISYFVLFHPVLQPFAPQDIVAWTLVLAGITLGFWAFITLRPGKFRIAPEPAQTAILIISGPYAFIRHPMYTALLLTTFGLFLNYPVIRHFVAFALLFILLTIKLSYEEKLLTEKFPHYTTYQAHTKRLIPFVY